MTEDKRIKLTKVVCAKCKASLMIKPTEKKCPVCRNPLPIPEKCERG